jgi:hypothetical protein
LVEYIRFLARLGKVQAEMGDQGEAADDKILGGGAEDPARDAAGAVVVVDKLC